MDWWSVLLGLAAFIGIACAAFLVARSPSFWVGVAWEILSKLWPYLLWFMKNRPKSEEEWADWRRLKQMKPSDMSPADKARLRELDKLNWEWKEKQ